MQMPALFGLKDWQWLFSIEASPAVIIGFTVLKALTDSPEKAAWLAADEKAWLISTLRDERAGRESQPGHAFS
ncbi:MFS transporter, partial [Escherichia coli]|nr:MFS transporter [Escherichia coli]